MSKPLKILVVEDDDGAAELVKRNLQRSGLANELIRFRDGEEVLAYLFRQDGGPHREPNRAYLMLLDIRMPKMDGVEVLARIKQHPELRKIPVIMLTTTDDPREVARCHELGCASYIAKPVDYAKFVTAIRQLGLFLAVVQIPTINGDP